MTNAELIAKIKASIEKRLTLLKELVERKGTCDFTLGSIDAYQGLLDTVISTIFDEEVRDREPEKPMEQDAELGKEIDRVVSEYSDKVQGTRVMKPSGVEKIARHFAELGYREGFLEGAKIQREEDNQLVDIIYQQGIEKGKDEMKEQAVGGELCYEPHLKRIIVRLDDVPDGMWNGRGTRVEAIIYKTETDEKRTML